MTSPGSNGQVTPGQYGLDQVLGAAAAATGSTRTRIQQLVESAPVEFNRWWHVAKHVLDGPIDVIDIFSGCGGMSAGFRAVNGVAPVFRNVLAIDIDEVSNQTYERNIKLRPVCADVHDLAKNTARLDELIAQSPRRPGNPLVLIGCAPCQGFSSHRNGAADDRNQLFADFAAIAVHLSPDFILIENVPEICTDRHWARVQEARRLLTSHGYRVHLSIHNFAEFGLPQERFRSLMIAARQPFRPPVGFLSRSEFRTVRSVI